MASFSAGTTFTDGVANDVTAAKLGALVNNATPTSGLIQDRTAETVTATNDTLLIGDASDSNNLKRITVANFAQTLPTAKITTGTIDTGTFGTTTSTAGSVTTGTIVTCTFGTTTSTAATITTGTIPTLVSTTLVTTGTGNAGAPAIAPTGDSNTGVFFPAADTIAFSEGGTEAMRIDSSGNVGIGKAPSYQLEVYRSGSNTSRVAASNDNIVTTIESSGTSLGFVGTLTNHPVGVITNNTERLRIDSSGNVGIGNTNPNRKLDVRGSNAGDDFLALRLWNESANTSNSSTSIDIPVFNGAGGLTIKQQTSSSQNYNCSILTQQSGASLILGSGANTERLRIDADGNVIVTGSGGLGYGTGSGGTVTQGSSRTTGVTINKTNGSITLVSAAGSTTIARFTVTNSTVAATDTVVVSQKSGTDRYRIYVTAVAAGSFDISFATLSGTTTEQPVFNFAVIKAVTS